MKILLLLLIPLIFLAGANVNAQDNNEKTIATMAEKLQQKVLLTEDQKNQVISILQSGYSEDAKIKVERLLDQRQKAKYDIIQSDWWKTLERELKEANK